MTWYIVKNQMFTLFLSLSHLTAVTFPERVVDYVGGRKGEFRVHQLNRGKTLVFEPQKTGINRNFIVFLKDRKFHFNLVHNENLSIKDITLLPGESCSQLVSLKETKNWQLFSCPRSLFFINRSNRPVQVNEQNVLHKIFLSKGPTIILNGKPIHHRGQTR